MSRINVIPYQEATGRLKEIYTDLISKRGKLANVHSIQSLRPESIVKHIELYMEILFSKSDLSRAEREMMAVIVSVANGCAYCQAHHAEALNHYWKNDEKVQWLKTEFRKAALSERERNLCEFASNLTLHPDDAFQTDPTLPLKSAGLTDNAILDATLVVAYFNFVNRIVLALGVDLEEDSGIGFNY